IGSHCLMLILKIPLLLLDPDRSKLGNGMPMASVGFCGFDPAPSGSSRSSSLAMETCRYWVLALVLIKMWVWLSTFQPFVLASKVFRRVIARLLFLPSCYKCPREIPS